ncbi:MAG: response regulator transcription factor [Proteobacteria bacterium]|nr:response regulator transcription factor [Pseudomonadota bacterium]
MAHTLLVVEDDENLRLALCDNLEDEGYLVRAASSLAEARGAFEGAALIILDIMLPDGDGYSFCRELRAGGYGGGVIMLTARTLEEDLVRGFEAGADDYLSKPYRLRELLARVAALLRRAGGAPQQVDQLGAWSVDRGARIVRDAEGPVALTRTEFDLIIFLLDHNGRALSRDEILDGVWGADVVVDGRTVDNFVSTLKKKLRPSAEAGWAIRTVRGVGYRLELGLG